ncbi:hypothetical protein C8R45DRAFT_928972 [Mycena sanguinolenta]|nr:hypothetical protein C8R45DRAFT_928972 [Mycena sanguinolenta]
MPKGPPKRSKVPRGPGGMFLSTQSHPNTSGSSDESDNLGSSSDSDIAALESDFELEQDPDYTEDWEGQPQPTTFEERKKMNEEKRAKIAAKKRNAEIRAAEHRLAGPVNNQKGKKQGPYSIGGTSAHTIREKSKKLKDDFKHGKLKISHEELQRQLEAMKSQGSSGTSEKKQQNIADMFGMTQKRPRAASILSEDDIQRASGMSSSSGRSKRLKTGPLPEEEEESSSDDDIQEISGMSSAPMLEEEEESSSSNESEIVDEVDISPEELESAARQNEGDAAVDSIAIADDIAEWDGRGKTLIGDCQACKAAKSRKPHLDGATTDEEGDMFGDDGNDTEDELDERPVDCCMRRLLSLQPDFAGEKSQLELVSD